MVNYYRYSVAFYREFEEKYETDEGLVVAESYEEALSYVKTDYGLKNDYDIGGIYIEAIQKDGLYTISPKELIDAFYKRPALDADDFA